jgi:hypothetical protein
MAKMENASEEGRCIERLRNVPTQRVVRNSNFEKLRPTDVYILQTKHTAQVILTTIKNVYIFGI